MSSHDALLLAIAGLIMKVLGITVYCGTLKAYDTVFDLLSYKNKTIKKPHYVLF